MLKSFSSASRLNEDFDLHTFLDWLSARWQTALAVALAVVLLSVGTYAFFSSRAQESWKAYREAPLDLSKMADPLQTEGAFKQLLTLLNQYPNLRPFYEGPAAQELLNQKKLPEALPLTQRTLERVKPLLPSFYLAFSENSIQIEQGRYEESLTQAYYLKKAMDDLQVKTAPTLYAFNLIRIALLEKQLGHLEKMGAAWKEVEQIRQGTHPYKLSPHMINWVLNHFDSEAAELKQFLN